MLMDLHVSENYWWMALSQNLPLACYDFEDWSFCVTDVRNEIYASWIHQKDSSRPGIEDRGEEGGEDGHKQRGREKGEKGGRQEGEKGEGKAPSVSTGFPKHIEDHELV